MMYIYENHTSTYDCTDEIAFSHSHLHITSGDDYIWGQVVSLKLIAASAKKAPTESSRRCAPPHHVYETIIRTRLSRPSTRYSSSFSLPS